MPFDSHLFREKALARMGQTEPLDSLLRVTAPREWMVLCALAIALLSVAAWVIWGNIEQRVAATCILAMPGQRQAIIAPESGTVVEVLVRTGERVERGQRVARINSTKLMHQARVARARIALLEQTPGIATNPDKSSLAEARAELLSVEAMLETSAVLTSPESGEMVILSLVPGQAVTAGSIVGRIRTGSDHRLEALAFVSPESADVITPGMRARITVKSRQGDTDWLGAEVAAVSPQPVVAPPWLSDHGFVTAPRSHFVRASLQEAPGSSILNGTHCQAWFLRPPVSLLRMLITEDAGRGRAASTGKLRQSGHPS